MTVRRMIQAGSADFLAAASTSLVAGVSVGTDGAGGQKEYRQQSGIAVSSTLADNFCPALLPAQHMDVSDEILL